MGAQSRQESMGPCTLQGAMRAEGQAVPGGGPVIRGRWQTEGGDKPASLARSRRCLWAFKQDKAAVSCREGAEKGADSPQRPVLLSPSELKPLFA